MKNRTEVKTSWEFSLEPIGYHAILAKEAGFYRYNIYSRCVKIKLVPRSELNSKRSVLVFGWSLYFT